jgi:hypothetical protein
MRRKSTPKKKNKLAGKSTLRRHAGLKKTKRTTKNGKTARGAGHRRERVRPSPAEIGEGIVEVIEVWGVESAGTEGEVNSEVGDSPESDEQRVWIES